MVFLRCKVQSDQIVQSSHLKQRNISSTNQQLKFASIKQVNSASQQYSKHTVWTLRFINHPQPLQVMASPTSSSTVSVFCFWHPCHTLAVFSTSSCHCLASLPVFLLVPGVHSTFFGPSVIFYSACVSCPRQFHHIYSIFPSCLLFRLFHLSRLGVNDG